MLEKKTCCEPPWGTGKLPRICQVGWGGGRKGIAFYITRKGRKIKPKQFTVSLVHVYSKKIYNRTVIICLKERERNQTEENSMVAVC